MKYYVFADETDPTCQASEHASFEEAQEAVIDLQKSGCANARMLTHPESEHEKFDWLEQ